MTKAVAYIRVSTTEQAMEGYSIAAQVALIKNFAERKKWELVDVYADEGISAATIQKRPALMNLLSDAQNSEFEKVIIMKVDRISRNTKDAMFILNHLENENIGLESVRENFDLTSPSGRAMFQILSSFAELERNKLSENVSTGMKQKSAKGGFTGGVIYGYDVVNAKIIPNDFEKKVLQWMFYLRIKGYSFNEISQLLNERGFTTKRGNNFDVNAIHTLLTNQTYKGMIERKYKNETIHTKGEHQAIISEKLFDFVQKFESSTRNTNSGYWLSNILTCPECGGHMVASSTTNKGKRIFYYSCRTGRKKGECNANSIRKEKAETLVASFLEEKLKGLKLDSLSFSQTNFYSEMVEEQKNRLLKQMENIKRITKNNVDNNLFEKIKELKEQLMNLESPLQKEHAVSYPTHKCGSLQGFL